MKKKRNLTKDPLKPFPTPNPLSRPVHKATLKTERAETEFNRQHPQPMTLMHKREKALGDIPWRKPEVSKGQIEAAANAMAAWDNANPFAYGQTALYTTQGYLRSDEVVKEMSQRTLARQAAKRKEVDDAKSHIG